MCCLPRGRLDTEVPITGRGGARVLACALLRRRLRAIRLLAFLPLVLALGELHSLEADVRT